jgi:hypothetical protein
MHCPNIHRLAASTTEIIQEDLPRTPRMIKKAFKLFKVTVDWQIDSQNIQGGKLGVIRFLRHSKAPIGSERCIVCTEDNPCAKIDHKPRDKLTSEVPSHKQNIFSEES